MTASKEQKEKVSEIINNPVESYDNLEPFDWRGPAVRRLRSGDIEGMKRGAAPLAEFKVIEIMNEAEDPKVQLRAAETILSQNGHGPVQKVEHSVPYDKLPIQQLMTMISAKLGKLKQLNPEFDISKLLPASKVVEAEIEEEDAIE